MALYLLVSFARSAYKMKSRRMTLAKNSPTRNKRAAPIGRQSAHQSQSEWIDKGSDEKRPGDGEYAEPNNQRPFDLAIPPAGIALIDRILTETKKSPEPQRPISPKKRNIGFLTDSDSQEGSEIHKPEFGLSTLRLNLLDHCRAYIIGAEARLLKDGNHDAELNDKGERGASSTEAKVVTAGGDSNKSNQKRANKHRKNASTPWAPQEFVHGFGSEYNRANYTTTGNPILETVHFS
jgi:hypothetical protein